MVTIQPFLLGLHARSFVSLTLHRWQLNYQLRKDDDGTGKHREQILLGGIKWKDTGKKCHSSNYGDAQTHSAHTDGRAKRKGTVWYNGLEDDISDASHKEQQGPRNVNFGHRCFLKSKRGKKRNSGIFGPIKHLTGVNTYLEGCNNTHSQTGEHPDSESSFIETRVHQLCGLTQLLHKLVPGVNGGRSCQNK